MAKAKYDITHACGRVDCLGLCAICETVLESINEGIEYSEDGGRSRYEKLTFPGGQRNLRRSDMQNKKEIEEEIGKIDVSSTRIRELLKDEGGEPDIVLRNSVFLGNPNKAFWPTDGNNHCFARGVQDLAVCEGFMWGGGGDWTLLNQGPVTLWNYNQYGALRYDETIQEEIVDCFYKDTYRGVETLWIASKDPRRRLDASVYVNVTSGHAWSEYATIPNTSHVYGMAVVGDNIYVVATRPNDRQRLFVKEPQRSWKVIEEPVGVSLANTVVTLASREILVFGRKAGEGNALGQNCLLRVIDQERLEKVASNPFPEETLYCIPGRAVAYRNGILYSNQTAAPVQYLPPQATKLYYFDANIDIATVVHEFEGEFVRDIVLGERPYVMTVVAEKGDLRNSNRFQGRIWSLDQDSLEVYQLVAEVTFPALPFSFEILNRHFYIALGTRGHAYADVHSGEVYRLTA